MRLFLTFTIYFASLTLVSAQTDTLLLEEIEVSAFKLIKYTHGSKISTIDLQNFSDNIDQSINANSGIYFKEYGNGQLTTVAFRGTSAAQTAVLWNGLSINSPTLGVTDFSVIPSYLIDAMTIQYGSSSAFYGSGAIGGAISLHSSDPVFKVQNKFNTRLELGNYGKKLLGGTAVLSGKKFISSSKVYLKQIKNDFPFTANGTELTQTNAAVDQRGVNQKFSWMLNDTQWLELEGMYIYNHREIQPTITNLIAQEFLRDRNLYVSAMYHNEQGPGVLSINGNFFQFDQIYNNTSSTQTSQISLNSDYDVQLNSRSSLKFGARGLLVNASNDSNLDDVRQNQVDVFLAANFRINQWWQSSINLRQSWFSNHSAPIAPSIGNEFTLHSKPLSSLKIRTSMSRSFRIPTLNDRFWNPGGNPDLKSEDSYNVEAGLFYKRSTSTNTFVIDLTHYRTWSKNWIVWLPTDNNFWTPNNIRNVDIHGIEFSSELNMDLGNTEIKINGEYSYVISINKKGLSEVDNTGQGKQLPYTPMHSGVLSVSIERGTWLINSMLDLTDKRYSTLDNDAFNSIDGYALLNIGITKKIEWDETKMTLSLSGNNISNTSYQNFKNYAMPGRNFSIELNINF